MRDLGGKVAVIAHCLLNVNTKVHGLGTYSAVHDEIPSLIEQGWALVQLPCPEATYLGMRRWGMTKEQYDSPGYRRHCRDILRPTIDTLEELSKDGCGPFVVLGIDGSPTCGVTRTCVGWTGGEPVGAGEHDSAVEAPERGIMIEELAAELSARGLEVSWRGIDE